jgi:hypothetical protein
MMKLKLPQAKTHPEIQNYNPTIIVNKGIA